MRIVFEELTSGATGFYRQRPGKPDFFCFDSSLKGDTDALLHWISYMLEGNRLLYPPQKSTTDYTLWLVDRQLHKVAGNTPVWPVRSLKAPDPVPMLAEVCPN